MPSASVERHLTAIVAADVVGYSRLMGADEKGTLLTLKQHRAELIDRLIPAYKGRLVKTTGDGLLMTFGSLVDAVSCALAMQSGMHRRNQNVPPERRMEFRIGVNIGDVIIDKGDVFGDGVNIAARLEQIAPPGGLCLSEDAYRQMRGKLDVPIVEMGEQALKNIATPVRAYRIEPDAAAAFDATPPTAEQDRRRPVRMLATAGVAAVCLLAGAVWFVASRDSAKLAPDVPAQKAAVAGAMPIIAVLPFANQTGDASQDYFADGITEEVIGALGRFNTLRVMGRNAIMRYKNQSPTREQIQSELGANYLVSGSVRRSGRQVRIAAQLTEANAGTVMWSDRYDGEIADIFEFQDTIVRRIAGTLAANITQVESRRQFDHPRPKPTAFDLVLRARAISYAASRTANRQFREMIAKAIELDPDYASAWALQAEAVYSQAVLGWTEFPDRELSRATADAQKAIALAPNEPDGYRALGRIFLVRAEYDRAQTELKRAIEINPSDANALAVWGSVQSFSGEIEAAIETLQLALKLDPMLEPNPYFDLTVAYYLAKRHEEAIHLAERGLARYPDFWVFNAPAAAAAARLGRKEQAARYAEALRRGLPSFDPDTMGSRFKDPAFAAYLRDGLKLAGL